MSSELHRWAKQETMKLVPLILLTAFSARFARAEIRMNSVTDVAGKGPLFVLEDTETKERASFIPLGAEFCGYTLDSYDSKTSTLTLKKGEAKLAIGFAHAEIKKMPPAITPHAAAAVGGQPGGDPYAGVSDDDLLKRGLRRTKPGDTVGRIAKERGVTLAALMELNPGLDPVRLKVGQVLRLKGE
jgi:LysM domain